jgi:hypothetical protein
VCDHHGVNHGALPFPSFSRFLVASVLFACGCSSPGCSGSRDPALAPPIAGAKPEAKLIWGAANEVPGTQVMRVDLIRERSGISSGYSEVRNILFLDPAEPPGRWLLPDSDHFFSDTFELVTDPNDPKLKHLFGTVTLLKQVGQESEAATGRLLLFDPVGRSVEWLAQDVRRLNAAYVTPAAEFVILYERNRQFVVAVVNSRTFKVSQERVFDIPALK